MIPRPNPHDFLLHLRAANPPVARRLDGVQGMAFCAQGLAISVFAESWTASELSACRPALEAEARAFFGPETAVVIEAKPPAPEALPFPIMASKVWNHVAFCAWAGSRTAVVAVRKPAYLDRWLSGAREAGEEALRLRIRQDPEVFVSRYEAPGDAGAPIGSLPRIAEDLCLLTREKLSYAQLVAAFPGDAAADLVESRLYAIRDWGTPRVPAAILQRYTGRFHYVSPSAPPLGVRLAMAEVSR